MVRLARERNYSPTPSNPSLGIVVNVALIVVVGVIVVLVVVTVVVIVIWYGVIVSIELLPDSEGDE
jgi:hypothetical protein